MNTSRLTRRTAAALCTMLLSGLSLAQGFPNKTVTLVVPNPPGGFVDASARLLSEPLSRVLSQTVVVDNKGGGSGNVAYAQVARANPDGYTLLTSYSAYHVGNPALSPKLPWSQKELAPVALITVATNVIAVHPSVPANTLPEFIGYLKANPGKLAFGHGSSGSLVSAAMISQMAGLQTINVPYKSIPPALTDLLGGQIQFAFADVGNAVSQMNGGRLRGLGVTTAKRAGKAPNVPPIGDVVKDYAVGAWFGLMAPAGLPADVHKKASSTLMAVLAKPEVRDKIMSAGIDLDVEDAAQLAKTIDSEIKKWAMWVKAANITPE